MVWQEPGCSCHVSTCSRVHCEDHRVVFVEFGLPDWSCIAVHVDATDPYTIYRSPTLHPSILVATIETDSSPSLFCQTETATPLNCHSLRHRIHYHADTVRRFACSSFDFAKRNQFLLHSLSEPVAGHLWFLTPYHRSFIVITQSFGSFSHLSSHCLFAVDMDTSSS